MATALFTSRVLGTAAKRRLAARYASKYYGASGYERGWVGFTFVASELPQAVPTCEARFSRPANATCSSGRR